MITAMVLISFMMLSSVWPVFMLFMGAFMVLQFALNTFVEITHKRK